MTNTKEIFQETLADIKQADDLTFISGINHSVLHGFNYSPPEVTFPGLMRYGTYFSEYNPWWPHLHNWTDYNARLSSILQLTRPQAQIAILGPTADVWSQQGLDREYFNRSPWYLHLIWQSLAQLGYGSDYVNERILQEAKKENRELRYGSTIPAVIHAKILTSRPSSADCKIASSI